MDGPGWEPSGPLPMVQRHHCNPGGRDPLGSSEADSRIHVRLFLRVWCVYACVQTCVSVRACVCGRVRLRGVCVCVCLCVYTSACVWTCTCTCVYAHGAPPSSTDPRRKGSTSDCGTVGVVSGTLHRVAVRVGAWEVVVSVVRRLTTCVSTGPETSGGVRSRHTG